MKILVAVDGSKPSLKAVQLLIDHCDWYREAPEVELLAVHLPVPKVGHLNKAQLERYYQEEGEGMLKAARKKRVLVLISASNIPALRLVCRTTLFRLVNLLISNLILIR